MQYPPVNVTSERFRTRRGSTLVEMTLVGIPLIFALISIFEIARAMWVYHTLAYALKEGTRYAIVHGINCTTLPNSCGVTVGNIAAKIRDAGVGLDPNRLQVQMQSLNGADDTGLQTLTTLLGRSTPWPTGTGAAMQAPVTFTAQIPFTSAMAMFWPGVGQSVKFGTFLFPASSRETVQF